MHLQRASALDSGEGWTLRVRSQFAGEDGRHAPTSGRLFLLTALACLLLFCGRGFAAPVRASHLTVELVTETTSIAPNHDFLAGLHFVLDPGWHIYWINAGDAGEPPRVDWQLPAGITAGDLQFPAPERLPLGPLMDFGYQHEVLLPIPMRADAQPSARNERSPSRAIAFSGLQQRLHSRQSRDRAERSRHCSTRGEQSSHGAAVHCCGASVAANPACGHVRSGAANEDGLCYPRDREERGECGILSIRPECNRQRGTADRAADSRMACGSRLKRRRGCSRFRQRCMDS